MSGFNELWDDIVKRSVGFPTVQDKSELEHVFYLMEGCESYLEVGTAEGNSLYVLAHALKRNARITYVDYGEKHTTPHRNNVVTKLTQDGYYIKEVLGDSHNPEVVMKANGRYDVVLIDAGHGYGDVVDDAENYGKMATKYIIFHDINLPEVRKAFDEYAAGKKSYTISNSTHFGYGIIQL